MKEYFFAFLCMCIFWSQAQDTKLIQLIENINPQGFTGFSLYDPDNKKHLVEYNSDKKFIPASNLKINTYYLYNSLSKNDSIPSLYYYETDSILYVRPLADPTFLDARFSSQKVLEFLKKANKPIKIDLSFPFEKYGAGWSWEDYDQYFMPERSVLPLYGNVLNENNEQHFDFAYLSDFKRDYHSNTFANNDEEMETPFMISDSLILALLQKETSITIDTIRKISALFPRNKHDWKVVYSNPKKEVLQEMMMKSDNFLAEQLLINAILQHDDNQKDTDDFIEESIRNFGWNTHFRIVDGSGLSRYNLVSPNYIVHLLEASQIAFSDNLDYFPINGTSGTLKNKYLQQKGYIYAKTGSMGGVYNLSGYLKTDKGNTLIFSLINNNQLSNKPLVSPIEALLLHIKNNY